MINFSSLSIIHIWLYTYTTFMNGTAYNVGIISTIVEVQQILTDENLYVNAWFGSLFNIFIYIFNFNIIRDNIHI